jgi:nucleoid-associated protein YgaU
MTTKDGKEITYLCRRFLPGLDQAKTFTPYTVVNGDRLDIISARYLGDPELFWRICDANTAMHPDDLTSTAGKKLRIPLITGS